MRLFGKKPHYEFHGIPLETGHTEVFMSIAANDAGFCHLVGVLVRDARGTSYRQFVARKRLEYTMVEKLVKFIDSLEDCIIYRWPARDPGSLPTIREMETDYILHACGRVTVDLHQRHIEHHLEHPEITDQVECIQRYKETSRLMSYQRYDEYMASPHTGERLWRETLQEKKKTCESIMAIKDWMARIEG